MVSWLKPTITGTDKEDNTMINYESFRMEIVLFDGEAWTDVVTKSGDLPTQPSKIEAAIAQAEEEYRAYQ